MEDKLLKKAIIFVMSHFETRESTVIPEVIAKDTVNSVLAICWLEQNGYIERNDAGLLTPTEAGWKLRSEIKQTYEQVLLEKERNLWKTAAETRSSPTKIYRPN